MTETLYDVLNATGTVVNTIVLNDPDGWPIPEGHTLRLVSDRVAAPEPLALLLLTQLAFLRRFTAAERIAIRASPDPVIVDFLHLLSLAQEINTSDSDTQAGVAYLEQQGFIAPGRAQEILNESFTL